MFTPLKELIERAASNCSREDCRLSYWGAHANAMQLGTSYDRNGNPLAESDSIKAVHSFSCSSCGKNFRVDS